MYHDINFPQAIQKLFPSAEKTKYSNGVISFTLFHGHTKDGLEQPIAFLTGFRQYLHYHFHAIKASLHTRMRKRVEIFQRVLIKAKRDQETGTRKFKETIGGQQIEDVKEEKKTEEVFTFKKWKYISTHLIITFNKLVICHTIFWPTSSSSAVVVLAFFLSSFALCLLVIPLPIKDPKKIKPVAHR